MNMKDFYSWVEAGNYDKPKPGDDTMHTQRLQQENKDVLSVINNITKNSDPRIDQR